MKSLIVLSVLLGSSAFATPGIQYISCSTRSGAKVAATITLLPQRNDDGGIQIKVGNLTGGYKDQNNDMNFNQSILPQNAGYQADFNLTSDNGHDSSASLTLDFTKAVNAPGVTAEKASAYLPGVLTASVSRRGKTESVDKVRVQCILTSLLK